MLKFDVSWKTLKQVGDDLQASDKQIQLALHRTLARLASRLAVLSRKELVSALQLRRVSALRLRLKSTKLIPDMGTIDLWYGLNDFPVSWLKGVPKNTATGATFRGVNFPGAFVAKSNYANQKTILKRKGKARLHVSEALLPIEDKATAVIEDDIFDKLEPLFWPMFERELFVRVKFKIGQSR